MDAQDQPRAAVTLREDREVPEEAVDRAGVSPASQSFQARSAETVTQGARRRRSAQAGKPAPPETPAPAARAFEAREAGTVTLRPPHWEGLLEAAPETEAGQEIRPEGIPPEEGVGIPTIIQVTASIEDVPSAAKGAQAETPAPPDAHPTKIEE